MMSSVCNRRARFQALPTNADTVIKNSVLCKPAIRLRCTRIFGDSRAGANALPVTGHAPCEFSSPKTTAYSRTASPGHSANRAMRSTT
ncbi:hypothetical protein BURMUCF1_2682 [Burkholderia multivorans ATCC BAA-247]|nr:hypothetical protein BURMUCF1_2682 [Burkholderia multivorans ATCC BAA-247]